MQKTYNSSPTTKSYYPLLTDPNIMIAFAIVRTRSKQPTKPTVLIEHAPTTGPYLLPPIDSLQYKFEETDEIPMTNPVGGLIKFRASIPKNDFSSCYVEDWGWERSVRKAREKFSDALLNEMHGAMCDRSVTMRWTPKTDEQEESAYVLEEHDLHDDQHYWWELKTVEVDLG
jgi:hypothetical protein